MIFKLENLNIIDKDSGFAVLQNINLTINRADFVLLQGQSGSGKSTLLRYMVGLSSPNHIVSYHNKISNGLVKGVMQNAMASLNPAFTVSQHFELIGKDGRALLANFGLVQEVYHSYPSSLSGGMAVRVVLALMLALDPKLLLLDEVDTVLDLQTLHVVINYLKQVNSQDLALVVVSHQSHLFDRYANKFYKMCDGRLLDE